MLSVFVPQRFLTVRRGVPFKQRIDLLVCDFVFYPNETLENFLPADFSFFINRHQDAERQPVFSCVQAADPV